MDDFANILERDYGLKPQGKMAPMSSSSSSASVKPASFSSPIGRAAPSAHPRNGTNRRSVPILSDDDPFSGTSSSSGRHNSFNGSDLLGGGYDDVFGGPPKYAPSSSISSSSQTFEDVFRPASNKPWPPAASSKGSSSYPVFDAPIYDDDIFGGLPGIRSVGSAYEDVFNLGPAGAGATSAKTSHEDLLGGFRSREAGEMNANPNTNNAPSAGKSAFDDLIPGFGIAEPAKIELSGNGKPSQNKPSGPVNGTSINITEDPFSVFDLDNVLYTDPMATASANNGVFEVHGSSGIDASNGTGVNSTPFGSTSPPDVGAESHASKTSKPGPSQTPVRASESTDSNNRTFSPKSYVEDKVNKERKRTPPGRVKLDESMSANSIESASTVSPSHTNKPMKSASVDDPSKRGTPAHRERAVSPALGRGEGLVQFSEVGKNGPLDEFWISIEDVKLVTQPTAAPPPIRPPPAPGSREGHAHKKLASVKTEVNHNNSSENGVRLQSETKNSTANVFGEFEDFASGSSRMTGQGFKDDGTFSPVEDEQGSAAAIASGAAMKEAIERAEAKLRQAKEEKARDEEEARSARNRERKDELEKEEKREARARREKEEREREVRDRETREREREERERGIEKERQREREKDRLNEIARQRAAVERANAEVREREAQKAVERAAEARAKAERAAVERATAEARERHERTAVEKARAVERAAAESRERAERERVAAASATMEQQRRKEDDLESFFRPTSRPTSAPKQRTQTTDAFSAAQSSSWKNSSSAFNVKKVPSMSSMADDLTSLFGGPSNPGTFQEIEGESADRRRARLERYLRTQERAAKALEEKHERDLQSARDQEDRHRAGELVDAEIKRWAAGKEGNLRALLSTLQYVLWPECGWQPVSLVDLITAAAVKKVYRKATLCVHPDKVQQKGATNQQKYIAEKVFDLLKEAWNKFNSEELF